MSAATSRYEDTPAIDLVNHVQADAVKQAVAGTAAAANPVLSIAAPFNREASIPAGQVTVRDVAGLYVFDNTLVGITMTGAQLKAYLETSAQYFRQVSGTGPFTADQLTNAPTPQAPGGTPDYNYDIVGGLDAPLTYDIDVAKPAGSRIETSRTAAPPSPTRRCSPWRSTTTARAAAVASRRVATAPVVYNAQQPIRELLIAWVSAHGDDRPGDVLLGRLATDQQRQPGHRHRLSGPPASGGPPTSASRRRRKVRSAALSQRASASPYAVAASRRRASRRSRSARAAGR